MPRATALLAALFCIAVPASAYRFDVEEWSAAWEGFADDFEDGVLPLAGGSGPPLYTAVCGVTAESESDGALQLVGPAACPGSPGAVLASTSGTSAGETRATFRFEVPALGQTYGVTVSDQTSTDTVLLVLTRNEVAGLFEDALLVALLADPFVVGIPTAVAFAILSNAPPHDSVSAAAIELRLVTAPGPGGMQPTGSYRLCANDPCEDEATTPFLPLAPSPTAPPDGGALLPSLSHGPALVAFSQGAGDFSFEVEEWSASGSTSDDFEADAFAEAAPYVFSCGSATDVEQADGVLSLLGPVEPCGGTGLAFLAAFPGPIAIQARYGFAVPGRCEAYGVSTGASGNDFAFLSLARTPDPLDPEGASDVLTVRLSSESESGGRWVPVVASARVSDAPLADPALADVRAIELVLELGVDLAGLVPTGRFRLCTDTGCPPAFTPLAPGAPTAEPDAFVCGIPAASYDPPADGSGAVVWEGPMGASLFATRVPEPGAGASAGVALLTLLALRRSRASHGRNRCPTKTRPSSSACAPRTRRSRAAASAPSRSR